MIKKILFIVLINFKLFELISQDTQFSQFFSSRLYTNPAFAGSNFCPNLSSSYRNQWPSLGQSYVSYYASYDQYADAIKGAFGFYVLSDNQGNNVFQSLNIAAIYTYIFKISYKYRVRMAIQGAFVQNKINGNKMIFNDMIDPNQGIIYQTSENTNFSPNNLIDFSTGIILNSKKHFFGIAVKHIAEYNISEQKEKIPLKFTVHYGTKIDFDLNDRKNIDFSLSPNIIFEQQHNNQILNYGLYISRKKITSGIWIKHNLKFNFDSAVFLLGFILKKIKLSYSYDLTLSKLRWNTGGSHEISFSFQMNCIEKIRKQNTIKCPSF